MNLKENLQRLENLRKNARVDFDKITWDSDEHRVVIKDVPVDAAFFVKSLIGDFVTIRGALLASFAMFDVLKKAEDILHLREDEMEKRGDGPYYTAKVRNECLGALLEANKYFVKEPL